MARDMTEHQFREALHRNQFQLNLGMWMQDMSGQTGTHYGVIADRTGRVYLRESLSHAIRSRAAEVRQIEQAAKLASQGLDADAVAARLRVSKTRAILLISKTKER